MANGLGGIFESEEAQGPQMAAPGIPAGALSGNPTASFVNTFLAGGANVGASLGGALGSLAGIQTVNPQQLAQERAAEFAREFQTITAEGKVMQGDALRLAAQKQYKAGRLAEDEYLRAIGEANKQSETDRKHLNEHLGFVRDSDAFKNYSKTAGIWQELKETVKRGESGKQSANDYLLIQQGLKILDPGSIVSDNEIQSGVFAAKGSRALKLAGINLTQLASFAATGGKGLELTSQQKEKWLKAISGAVDAQKNDLSSVYLTAEQGYGATGGAAPIFQSATMQIRDLLSKEAYTSIDELAAAGAISEGVGYNNPMDMLRAGVRNGPVTYKPLVDLAVDIGKMGVEAGWGLMFGDDEPAKPRGKRAPRMGRGAGGRNVLPEFNPADNNLGRLLDPVGLQQSLMAAYQTDNAIHAQIFDALRDEPIETTLNKAHFLQLIAG